MKKHAEQKTVTIEKKPEKASALQRPQEYQVKSIMMLDISSGRRNFDIVPTDDDQTNLQV